MIAVDPLRAAHLAAAPRTLVDILEAATAAHPEAPAIDDGTTVLTYRELLDEVALRAATLGAHGVRRGDRVGVRATSGRADLYLSILAVLYAGAAYVPVDKDDPDERAELVFGEAMVAAILGDDGAVERQVSEPVVGPDGGPDVGDVPTTDACPGTDDDAWIIFTSGSTGTPKGVAVTHRNAAAFVDAEANLFLQPAPLGPGDRVLAGLSVAFDASCEEMWLAWRYGACLVPAPRALVRTGMDLGPWLVERGITVVSTVPTLAGLLPPETLAGVRLLIFGGEACPPELARRLTVPGREVWNTYGPTEATVVACASLLDGGDVVRIGLPLDGWDLAVVDPEGNEVARGETGELIIGGVGLARYLDPTMDAAKYAAMPTLGWDRAYRSGDLVVRDDDGLLFVGRADDQVKIGGRRIELGELDAALLALDGVAAAAAAVRTTAGGQKILVGYLVPEQPVDGAAVDGATFDTRAAIEALRRELPAALVPLLGVVDDIPTRTSGKLDRDALPWPLPSAATPSTGGANAEELDGTAAWIGSIWASFLGIGPTSVEDDFFELGGGSLTAAQIVSALRARDPRVTVADVYAHPALGDLAAFLDSRSVDPGDVAASAVDTGPAARTPRSAQAVQVVAVLVFRTLAGLRWLTWLAALNNVFTVLAPATFLHPVSWWWVAVGWLVLISPIGRLVIAAAGSRLLLRGVSPGDYPRGGSVHLRIWLAENLVGASGGLTAAGAPLVGVYARALGAKVGRGVDLHTLPPVTGMLTLGDGCAVEPEVDLSGHWLDGDTLHVGTIKIGEGATVGARSTLLPGARIGKGSDIAAGSAVSGKVKQAEYWGGSPAARLRAAVQHPWPDARPGPAVSWAWLYGLSGAVLSLLPLVAAAAGVGVMILAAGNEDTFGDMARAILWSVPLATLVAFFVYALIVVGVVRGLAGGIDEGYHPVRSRVGLQAWATQRLMDSARTLLFPIYSSVFTPMWLRMLGAKVGRNVEASTVLGIPSMMRVANGAFLADDTMVAPYELGGGWMRVATARVGKRAFLGNSGITAPGRSIPKNGLVAVLSATPMKAKAGSSWLGSPPTLLRRAVTSGSDEGRTFAPPRRLLVMRGALEVLRLLAPIATVALAVGTGIVLFLLVHHLGYLAAALLSGVVLLVAGVLGALLSSAIKWLLVGRVSVGEHPLWSSMVWRNELADTFTEMVAAPWFAEHVYGTPLLTAWLRTLGATIGRGVWCESYWLPEADLVTLGDGVSVGRGCVVQTHLFHDRVMSLDEVVLEEGSSLGPHGVILPAARLGKGASVGPASLVMRGESVPAGSRWRGNPIVPWSEPAGASG